MRARLPAPRRLQLPAGCSPPLGQARERVVFANATGFGPGGRNTTADIVDVGVPGLHNLTSRSARVRKVRLVPVPAAVRLLGVSAHPGQAVGVLDGDLSKLCRKTYPPYPVTDAVAAPHADSNWHLVLAITFTAAATPPRSRPGLTSETFRRERSWIFFYAQFVLWQHALKWAARLAKWTLTAAVMIAAGAGHGRNHRRRNAGVAGRWPGCAAPPPGPCR
jgi:hypothetical protein